VTVSKSSDTRVGTLLELHGGRACGGTVRTIRLGRLGTRLSIIEPAPLLRRMDRQIIFQGTRNGMMTSPMNESPRYRYMWWCVHGTLNSDQPAQTVGRWAGLSVQEVCVMPLMITVLPTVLTRMMLQASEWQG
jgi:hypothetical protein